MHNRFIDIEDLSNAGDFKIRRNKVYLNIAAILFLISLLLVISILHYNSHYVMVTSIIVVIFSTSFLSVYYLLRREYNLSNLLELQNALFAGSVNLTSKFFAIIKNDGTLIYVTPEYSSKFFYSRESVRNGLNTLCDFGSISKTARQNMESALKVGGSTLVDFCLPEKVGEFKPLSFTLEPIGVYDPKIKTSRLNLAVNPIARPSGYFLFRAEDDSETTFRKCFSDLKIGYFTTDKKGNITLSNEIFEQMLGYEKSSIVLNELSIEDLLIEDNDIEFFLENGEFNRTVLLHTKTGSNIKVLVNQHNITDEDGNITGRRAIVFPLYESNKGQKISGLQNVDEMDFIEYSPIATAVADDKGNIIKANKAFYEMVPDNTKSILEALDNSNKTEIKKLLDKACSGKLVKITPTDVKIAGDDNKAASLYLSNSINDEQSKVIAHFIDTTELKNLELRFVHSQKMQAIGQLAGGIAHDFNNLLTAMIGFCDLLLMRHPAGDPSFADIMQVKQNANRAANLVRQLLAFSRKQTLQPKTLDITEVISDLSNLIRRLIGEKIELDIKHGKDIGYVKVDQGQLEQVIVNLAVNARDAMEGGGTLTIKTSNVIIDEKNGVSRNMIPPAEDEVIEPGKYVLVEIIDTGCGIPKDMIGKIFEPFFSTKEVGEGTGLGLATVYGIVKQTDGYIYVSSKEGKGTKFSIFLKLMQSDSRTAIKKSSDDITEKSVDLTGHGTVLIVEDEDPVRIFSTSALTNKGYKVLEAENGETALDIVKEHGKEIDIIVTDVVMPGMNGPAMIEQISKKYPSIKVIFVSGYGEDEFIKTYGEDRKFHFLSKPYTLKQLASKVKEVLGE